MCVSSYCVNDQYLLFCVCSSSTLNIKALDSKSSEDVDINIEEVSAVLRHCEVSECMLVMIYWYVACIEIMKM